MKITGKKKEKNTEVKANILQKVFSKGVDKAANIHAINYTKIQIPVSLEEFVKVETAYGTIVKTFVKHYLNLDTKSILTMLALMSSQSGWKALREQDSDEKLSTLELFNIFKIDVQLMPKYFDVPMMLRIQRAWIIFANRFFAELEDERFNDYHEYMTKGVKDSES